MSAKKWTLNWLALVLVVPAALVGGASAVEIYRIGGADVPQPQGENINFHQLQWRDFTEKQSLDEEKFAAGILEPIFLGPETNIALTSVERNAGPYVRVSGVASYSITELSKQMIDGDPLTYWEWVKGLEKNQKKVESRGQRWLESRRITMDLGGLFFINRVRIIAAESGLYPDKLDVAADLAVQKKDNVSGYGAARIGGVLVYELAGNVRDTIDVSFPPALARSIGMMLYRTSVKPLLIGELEVYGTGYTNQAHYIGALIDLGEPAIWGDISWGGRQDDQARVWIQSRAGRDEDPNLYWRFSGRGDEVTPYNQNGKLLNASEYKKLKPGEPAEITYDTENWSFWSAPYEFDADSAPVNSPGPNRFFQLRVDFLPLGDRGGAVDYIQFAATKPPLAEDVLGEISPTEVPLGEVSEFAYLINPTIRAAHSGFDQIEISTPFGFVEVDSVAATGLTEWQVVEVAPDSTSFTVLLSPRRTRAESGGVVEVFYRAPVLRFGTAFDAWVSDSQRPEELAQRVNPGNAADEVLSEVITVRTTLSKRLLADLVVSPQTATPNGDGINDEIAFSFDLLQITGEVPLSLEVYDLSGRLRRVIYEGQQQSSSLVFSWDGRDDSMGLVPPGLYVYRLSIEAEKGEDQQIGTIGIVY